MTQLLFFSLAEASSALLLLLLFSRDWRRLGRGGDIDGQGGDGITQTRLAATRIIHSPPFPAVTMTAFISSLSLLLLARRGHTLPQAPAGTCRVRVFPCSAAIVG